MDLAKALRESTFPDLRRPQREIWVEPTLEDLHDFAQRKINGFLAVDIETSGRLITCVGFAPLPHLGLVIPFYDARRKGHSYWPSPKDERAAWEFVREILEDAGIKKVFQNGMFDIAVLWRAMRIKVLGAEHDTMLLHHALQPESLKGLGYLGSIYTDEAAWKEMRTIKSFKRDD